MKTNDGILLSFDEAKALRKTLENYMKEITPDTITGGNISYSLYRQLWNDADKALVPLRGGPMSMENRLVESPQPDPLADE